MSGFVPALIAPEPSTAKPGDDRIEIVLARGRRVIIGAGVDAAALARVLDALERQRCQPELCHVAARQPGPYGQARAQGAEGLCEEPGP